jgi:type IV secretory pathway VirB10-like protein
MTEPKVDPETLALRAPPRPVTRLNRRTLTLVVGVLAAAVFGATLWSLQAGRRIPRELPAELHNVDRVTRAEGLDQLPQDYSTLSNPTLAATAPVPPLLGPPLPGDLGGPILRAERQGAIASTVPGVSVTSLRADPYEDAARVERLNRQREAEEAAKAPLFFRGSTLKEGAPAPVLPLATGSQPITPESPTAASNPTGSTNQTNGQNMQDQKRAFMDRASDAATRSTHALLSPVSPYQVMAGTIIPAALVTGINSDLPGQVIATVTEAVYDSAIGRHLLIPQGSRLLGQYDSQVAFGQRRVLLVWTRLMLPDASSITLDRLPGVDPAGYTGLEDDVDWHWKQLLAGAALSTLIGVGAELAAPDRSNGQSQVVVATRGSLQDTINQVGQELTRRNLNVQPTLTIHPGFPVRVIVNKDLILRPYQPLFFEKTER